MRNGCDENEHNGWMNVWLVLLVLDARQKEENYSLFRVLFYFRWGKSLPEITQPMAIKIFTFFLPFIHSVMLLLILILNWTYLFNHFLFYSFFCSLYFVVLSLFIFFLFWNYNHVMHCIWWWKISFLLFHFHFPVDIIPHLCVFFFSGKYLFVSIQHMYIIVSSLSSFPIPFPRHPFYSIIIIYIISSISGFVKKLSENCITMAETWSSRKSLYFAANVNCKTVSLLLVNDINRINIRKKKR